MHCTAFWDVFLVFFSRKIWHQKNDHIGSSDTSYNFIVLKIKNLVKANIFQCRLRLLQKTPNFSIKVL